nr:peptidoglycan-binding protein LysM [Moraxella sp. CTOTU47579]
MGLFSFAKDIGDKIFHRNKSVDTAAPASNVAPTAAPAASTEPSAQEIANLLIQRIQQNAKIDNLSVNYDGNTDKVTINGSAANQAEREKAILAAGNVQYVAQVEDNITVATQEPESRMYTVKSGDTLSKISKEVYGDTNQYNKIFEANKPLLSDPNKIYPGQVLRIPA